MQIHPRGMDCCFHLTRNSKSQLVGGQNTWNGVDGVEACTFRSKPPDGTPHSNWANATIFLRKCCKFSAKQETADCCETCTFWNQGDQLSNTFKTLSAPSSAGCPMRSFRCCGSKPSVPPLELLGNNNK